MQQDTNIDIKNLCSRKLWEIFVQERRNNQQKTHIEQELITRQHYIQELNKLRQNLH